MTTHGLGRQGRHLRRLAPRGVERLRGRHDARDEPRFVGLLRVESLAEKQELGGALVAGHERKEIARRELGHEPELRERHREPRVVAGVYEVAMQQERGADPDGGPRHGGHERLLRGAHRVKEPEYGRLLAAGRALREVLEVVAGRERFGQPMEEHGADGFVALGFDEVRGHRGVHVLRQRVSLLRAVDADRQDGIAPGRDDVRRHPRPPETSMKAPVV